MQCPLRSRARRLWFFLLVFLSTFFALVLLASVYQRDGLSPLEIALLLLYAVLISWISFSFWAATIGFLIQWRGQDPCAISASRLDVPLAMGARTALLMPIFNEEPRRVFAGLEAVCEDLIASGQHQVFDLFVLSDSRDPDLWVEEELRWQQLAVRMQGRMRVFYRNREQNSGRKVGNLKDFCERWGGDYPYFVVLDADSLMSGETLVKMVQIMEANPRLGLLQVPPSPVDKASLFARILQFASSIYGPLFTAGLNFWQMDEGNYWGHNAIVRTRAFTEHCGLPRLPGSEPFGGEILSHDFVEAAMLRRGGWQVWLAYDLGGSYEELPPTLIDYAKRDRRWCQGNLQHTKLVFARGWHPISRLHFLMGIMSYLSSPLWFLFLLLTGLDAYIRTQHEPVYFFGDTLFPIWPESYSVEMTTVLIVTLAMLFLPKLLALVLLLAKQPERLAGYGGRVRASVSVLLETLTSALLAPVLMLFQSQFVLAILMRRNAPWTTQQRGDHQTALVDAVAAHGGHTLLGLLAGWASYRYVPEFFWWLTPVLLGMLLSIPLSMLLSSRALGLKARGWGLFMIPEETQPPMLLLRLKEALAKPDQGPLAQPGSRFLQAIQEPQVNALHCRLLPLGQPLSTRRQHELQGLVYRLLEEGPERLGLGERRALLGDPDTLIELHLLTWSLPRRAADFGSLRL